MDKNVERGFSVKNVSMLVWLTQLGLSVAVTPCCFILLALWLRNALSLGNWILWVGIGIGIYCAITGLYSSLKMMLQMSKRDDDAAPVSFNDHD